MALPNEDSSQIATYDDVLNLDPNTLLVDVRQPEEIEITGSLPNSINIPLDELDELVELSPDEFSLKFNGKSKPTVNTPIIFSCKAGGRALKAATKIKNLGYLNVKYYKGSWTEWHAKHH